MIILGVDPGLRLTGYGGIHLQGPSLQVVEAGVVRTTDKAELGDRLAELSEGLSQVIEHIRPEVMVVESLYSNYNHPRTAILMGHARGVIIYIAASYGVPVVNYPATRIKKSLTGAGRATKSQMQRTIASVLDMDRLPEPADVADALAVALCHANVVRHGPGKGVSAKGGEGR